MELQRQKRRKWKKLAKCKEKNLEKGTVKEYKEKGN